MKQAIFSKPKMTAQERQDAIFRRMSADRKVQLGSDFWRLAKELVGNKISYGTGRSAAASRRYR